MESQKTKRGYAHGSPIFPQKMYAFVIPALTLFLVFWIFPVFQMFYYSFTNFNGVNYNYAFVGFKNFIQLFKEGTLINSIRNTLIYTVLIVLGTNLLGLVIAIALNVKLKGKTFFRTCSYIPALFSAAAPAKQQTP